MDSLENVKTWFLAISLRSNQVLSLDLTRVTLQIKLSHCKFTLQMFSYYNILMFYSVLILSPYLCFCTCLFQHSLSVIVLLLAHCNVILLTVPPLSPLSFLNPAQTFCLILIQTKPQVTSVGGYLSSTSR